MYLSIIITGRNDNYGGDFRQRIQNFITWNTHILEKQQVETEIIIVNWNPISDAPSMFETLQWPKNRKYVQFRIISVSNEIHKKYADPKIRKTVPLFEYLAKNVGIRRAKGEYILAMNPDIIIPEDIVSFIGKKKLDKKKYYRTDRLDYKKIKIVNTGEELITEKNQPLTLWLKGFKYPLKFPVLFLEIFYLKLYNRFRLFFHLNLVHFEKYLWILGWQFIKDNAEFIHHCNVSGDFFLMHKDSWFNLKGNPENTYLALHTDALMIVISGCSGLKEVVFPQPIFHQDHTRRFNAEEKENKDYYNAYQKFESEAQIMIKKQKPIIYNDDSWGLVNFELPEKKF